MITISPSEEDVFGSENDLMSPSEVVGSEEIFPNSPSERDIKEIERDAPSRISKKRISGD